MRIKICGITNVEDALLCQDLGADALGFVFYDKSPRCVNVHQVRSMISKLSPFVTTVGVFVNAEAKKINENAGMSRLHAVQLHGDESPAMLTQIDRPVIKAFRVGIDFDFHILEKFSGCGYLLDNHNTEVYGGSGQSFDWNLIPQQIRSRVILAGGISAENIETVFRTIRPAAVDLSSALESQPGKKDHEKVERFFRIVKKYRKEYADLNGP